MILEKIIAPVLVVIALLASMWSPDASAQEYYWYPQNGGSSNRHATPDAACLAGYDIWKATLPPDRETRYKGAQPEFTNRYKCISNTYSSGAGAWGADFTFTNAVRGGSVCPPNTTYNATTGICDPDPDCPAAGTVGPEFSYIAGWRTGPATGAPAAGGSSSIPGSFCTGQCVVSVTTGASAVSSTPAANGYYPVDAYVFTAYTGASCSGQFQVENAAPPNEPPPEKNRCPSGTVASGIDENGMMTCEQVEERPTDPAPEQEEKTVQENPDGSKTETVTNTRQNSDGSTTTTTTTTTTNADGSSTSSTSTSTGNTPDGKPGKNDGNDDFCKKNPQLTVCKNSAVTGSCEDVKCDGDAIQCAIMRDIRLQKCAAEKAEKEVLGSGYYKLGDLILKGQDPDKNKLPSIERAEVINLDSLDQSGFVGASQCLADTQFTVKGRQITIPWSSWCDYLLAFRFLFMVLAGMRALSILRAAAF